MTRPPVPAQAIGSLPLAPLFETEQEAGTLASPPAYDATVRHDWLDASIFLNLFFKKFMAHRAVRWHMSRAAATLSHVLMPPKYQRGLAALQHFVARPDSLDSAGLVVAWVLQPCDYYDTKQFCGWHVARIHQMLREAFAVYYNEHDRECIVRWVRMKGHIRTLLDLSYSK